MSKTSDMQERDARMFGDKIRERVYRGKDNSFTSKGEIGVVSAIDHGVRPLLGKFSQFNLSYLTPEQRKVFLEQAKYEASLSGDELNQYLSERYSDEDMYQIWLMQQKASQKRKKKIAPKNNMGLKQRISRKQKRRVFTPEERAAITAKAKATRERNKHDPNYVSHDTLKREFRRRQKLLAARQEAKLKAIASVLTQDVVQRKVKAKTRALERENQQLKEYLKQNNMPLPGTAKDKMRREQLRANKNF